MNFHYELQTITTTLEDLAGRISIIVESTDDSVSGDAYQELVAAERSVGALLRRLQRLTRIT
ncbi:MAG: hypothetical protein WCG86_01350 [Actinomycetota bacterium]